MLRRSYRAGHTLPAIVCRWSCAGHSPVRSCRSPFADPLRQHLAGQGTGPSATAQSSHEAPKVGEVAPRPKRQTQWQGLAGRVQPPIRNHGKRLRDDSCRGFRMILAARKKGSIRPGPFRGVNDHYPFSPALPPLTPGPRDAYTPETAGSGVF